MHRRVARAIHRTTSMTFWLENPNWRSGNPVVDALSHSLRALPFSAHEKQKRAFFDMSRLIAVNGESVVVGDGNKVNKFMFRYPGNMSLETFAGHVTQEIEAVTRHLASIALATQVSIRPADIFQHIKKPPLAVTQVQPRLDLESHLALAIDSLVDEPPSSSLDKTAADLERLLSGVEDLTANHYYYPDIAYSSGNLRRSILDGSVTLIDVMPIYANGSRLIGDKPPNLLPHILSNIDRYRDFVGRFGA